MDDIGDMEYFDDDENDTATSIEQHTKRWENTDVGKNENLVVLEPDHPLMQKFQLTLNTFLEKENERVGIEILELTENLKKNRENYEKQMCHEVYNLEQDVSQQRKLITEQEGKFNNIEKVRYEKDAIIKTNREIYKEQYNTLNDDKKKDSQLLGELEALTLLCRQYELWEKDTNSELAVNQRISEKIKSDKLQLIEEKKKMDLTVYKLTTEVWNLESQIGLAEDQIKIKLKEFEDANELIGNGTADLQALEVEQRQLIQLWNSAVINIQQKDKLLSTVNEEYEKTQCEFKTVISSIEALKKEISSEMQNHETIMMTKNKINFELMDCSKSVETEIEKKSNLEASIIDTSSALEITEKDLHFEKFENSKYSNSFKSITMQHEKLINEKISLENETLDKLQDRLSSDKTVEDLAARIKRLKNDTRKNEINMLSLESQHAKLMLKIEKQKFVNSQKFILVNDEKNVYGQKQAEISVIENKLKEILYTIEKQQTNLDIIYKKIDSTLEKTQGIETSPIERKVYELEVQIAESTTMAKDIRRNWIRMQKHVIQLTNQYQKQISENELTQEHVQILEFKSLKLKHRIDVLKRDRILVQRSIDAELIRIEQLSKQKYQNKCNNKVLEAKYNDLTLEYMAKLKDAEMQLMTIQEEIGDIENEKEQLAIELHNLTRKIKYWQKMEIIAVETKQKVKEEKGATGEIGKMKMEIHRMQVRHGQVSRTAARLASDLAQAVWRRAAAVNRSRACPQNYTPKYTFSVKNKEKRSDIRRLNQEIELNHNSIQALNNEQNILEKNIQEKIIVISTIENEVAKLRQRIDEDLLRKQKNLENIVRNQRYGQHCSLILNGRLRVHSVKSEPGICLKYNKQTKINYLLTSLVKDLLTEIPEQRTMLMRILNTLNVNDEEM
ncbi:coiled-coil domain-containing protein 40-like [Arctopsyche grandis]|uniref:coiled-coil domain-containing protein 40-like n=1 Tax=Arctopsyche grandis TaxID=121162 RepID=UPI00406D7B0C